MAQLTETVAVEEFSGFIVSLSVAAAVTGSVVFFGWVIRNVLRFGARVESQSYGMFEAVLALGWLGVFTSLALAPTLSASPATTRDSAFTIDQLLSLAAFQITLYAVPAALLVLRKHNLTVLFGLDSVSVPAALGWAFAGLVAFYPLLGVIAAAIQAVYGAPPPEQEIMEMVRATSGLFESFLLISFAVVLAPVCEEFFFRGLLYGAMKNRVGLGVSAVLSSLAFGLVHAHIPSLVPLTALGLVFVLLYERTGSLLVPMAMHSLFNGATLIASRFHPGS